MRAGRDLTCVRLAQHIQAMTKAFVLAHTRCDPRVRPGGTTFHFVNEGPVREGELARAAAGDRDVRIAADAVVRQGLTLDAGDELEIDLAPVLFGGRRRPFERIGDPEPGFRIARVLEGPSATHPRDVRTPR